MGKTALVRDFMYEVYRIARFIDYGISFFLFY